MVCVYCGGKTSVINSRWQRRNNQVWRRRRCLKCQAIFTTHEAVELSSALKVENGNDLQPFLPDRLLGELLSTLSHRKDVHTASREVTATVIKRLMAQASNPVFTPKQISREAATVLKHLDRRAYLKFLAEHPSLEA